MTWWELAKREQHRRSVETFRSLCASTCSLSTLDITECLADGDFGNRSIRRFATSCSTMLGGKLCRREFHQRPSSIYKDRVANDEDREESEELAHKNGHAVILDQLVVDHLGFFFMKPARFRFVTQRETRRHQLGGREHSLLAEHSVKSIPAR